MLKEMYGKGFNWCLKYSKGAILVLLVYLLLEIAKKLINKYFGININDIFLPEHFSIYGSIIFCFMFLVETWVNLEFLNYIYKGESEEKYSFILFNKVKAYIMPAFIGGLILNLVMLLPVLAILKILNILKVTGSSRGILAVLLPILILFVVPFIIWFSLRLSFYFEVIIINSIKNPILALKESFKITNGRLWDIIRVLVLPALLVGVVFVVLPSIIQKMGCSSCDFEGYAGAIAHPLFAAVSLALYLEFRKNPAKENEGEKEIAKE
ncbi:MAG: hypothetical protein KKD35_05630 [Elusimicrobia bacterium]|nr:hypothetical protein [Elusimicrobiota bacterium]